MEMCVLAWRWIRAFCLFVFVSFAPTVEGAGKMVMYV